MLAPPVVILDQWFIIPFLKNHFSKVNYYIGGVWSPFKSFDYSGTIILFLLHSERPIIKFCMSNWTIIPDGSKYGTIEKLERCAICLNFQNLSFRFLTRRNSADGSKNISAPFLLAPKTTLVPDVSDWYDLLNGWVIFAEK